MYGIVMKLSLNQQNRILKDCREALAMAPLYSNYMPQRGMARRDCTGNCTSCLTGGRTFGPQSTSFGPWGWQGRPCGYKYISTHPKTGESFPPIPESSLSICSELAENHGFDYEPQSSYVSWYTPTTTLGRHQDISEKINRPVVSISIGCSAIFEWGGAQRNDPYQDVLLKSGDVFLFGEKHRYNFHSIKKLVMGSAPAGLDIKPGRINITIRQYE